MEKRETYNKIVGLTKDNTLIILEDTFDYGKGGLHGATRIEMRPLTQAEIDAGLENEEGYCKELWQNAVASGNYEDSLADFIDEMRENRGEYGYFVGDEDSFREQTAKALAELDAETREKIEKTVGDHVDWDCASCGRIGDDYQKWDWKLLVAPELLDTIKKAEEE